MRSSGSRCGSCGRPGIQPPRQCPTRSASTTSTSRRPRWTRSTPRSQPSWLPRRASTVRCCTRCPVHRVSRSGRSICCGSRPTSRSRSWRPCRSSTWPGPASASIRSLAECDWSTASGSRSRRPANWSRSATAASCCRTSSWPRPADQGTA